jgi:hypothetical protein
MHPSCSFTALQQKYYRIYNILASYVSTIMKFSSTIILLVVAAASSSSTSSSVSAFAPPSSSSSSMMMIRNSKSSTSTSSTSTSALNIVVGDTAEAFAIRVKSIFSTIVKSATKSQKKFDSIVKLNFPGAITNQELVQTVVSSLSKKGYNGENTLLATSLCCDELARKLEDDFNGIYGKNFNLGGLGTLYIYIYIYIYIV